MKSKAKPLYSTTMLTDRAVSASFIGVQISSHAASARCWTATKVGKEGDQKRTGKHRTGVHLLEKIYGPRRLDDRHFRFSRSNARTSHQILSTQRWLWGYHRCLNVRIFSPGDNVCAKYIPCPSADRRPRIPGCSCGLESRRVETAAML